MPITVLSSLLLAGALPATDAAAIEARVNEIFGPYSRASEPKPSWQVPVFSAATAALIAHWEHVRPEDEPDELDDGDWFCMCQDWDKTKFKASAGPARLLRPNLAEVTVRVDLGFDAPRQERMIFTKEGNGWRLDDLFHPGGFPHGLKQALRQAIVADEATRRRHT